MSVSKRNRIQAGGGAGHHTANVEVWEDFLPNTNSGTEDLRS